MWRRMSPEYRSRSVVSLRFTIDIRYRTPILTNRGASCQPGLQSPAESHIVSASFGVTMSRYRIAYALIAVCAAAFAQSSGTLTGIITDPSQANLPGVSLALTNEAT